MTFFGSEKGIVWLNLVTSALLDQRITAETEHLQRKDGVSMVLVSVNSLGTDENEDLERGELAKSQVYPWVVQMDLKKRNWCVTGFVWEEVLTEFQMDPETEDWSFTFLPLLCIKSRVCMIRRAALLMLLWKHLFLQHSLASFSQFWKYDLLLQ